MIAYCEADDPRATLLTRSLASSDAQSTSWTGGLSSGFLQVRANQAVIPIADELNSVPRKFPSAHESTL